MRRTSCKSWKVVSPGGKGGGALGCHATQQVSHNCTIIHITCMDLIVLNKQPNKIENLHL